MGPGDIEIPLAFNGRTGCFEVVAAPMPAVRATSERRAAGRADDVVARVLRDGPLKNATALARALGGNRKQTLAAIKAELQPGGRLQRTKEGIVAVPGSGS